MLPRRHHPATFGDVEKELNRIAPILTDDDVKREIHRLEDMAIRFAVAIIPCRTCFGSGDDKKSQTGSFGTCNACDGAKIDRAKYALLWRLVVRAHVAGAVNAGTAEKLGDRDHVLGPRDAEWYALEAAAQGADTLFGFEDVP